MVDFLTQNNSNHSMFTDRTALERAYQANTPLEFLMFWGHRPLKDGSIGASCLSQWWPAAFEVAGLRYPTAEHWMMAEKARLFGDQETAAKILSALTPQEVKQLGREARGFDPHVWDREKAGIVEEGNFHKFAQNTELAAFLIATGEQILVEASPVDRIWGIGLAADHPDAQNPLLWRGENLLGFAQMKVRSRLTAS
jgi:ribA/ribD-fused uncharacterized protein